MKLVYICLGVVVGIVISAIWVVARVAGTIRVHVDEEGVPYTFAEIHKNKSHLIFKGDKLVVFRTKHENYTSQK